MDNQGNRHLAAKLARQLFAKQITFKQLVDNYPEDTEDKDIDKLFDLIEHQPKLKGLFGASQSQYDSYNSKILRLIELLEMGIRAEYYGNGQIAEQGEYRNGEYHVINFWTDDGRQTLKDGTGKTIRKFGATQGDIYEQYFDKGQFKGEKKISGVVYGQFIPDKKNKGNTGL